MVTPKLMLVYSLLVFIITLFPYSIIQNKEKEQIILKFIQEKNGLKKEAKFDVIHWREYEYDNKTKVFCKFYNPNIGKTIIYETLLYIENGKVTKDSTIEYRILKSYQF